MNQYLNIDRLEFLVTKRCTGKCKHCSVMTENRNPDNSYEDFERIIAAMKFLLDNFAIRSIMTFGGEPLLYSEITATIHAIGEEYGVERRELITNGYFSRKEEVIGAVAKKIIESGVNQILLSMDAFHQESIPMKYVEMFVRALIISNAPSIWIHPAWVVSRESDNDYNKKTEVIIKKMSRYNVNVSNGNNIILSGLAKKNLSKFYVQEKLDLSKRCGEIPFTNSPCNVKSVRILPNGNINICRGLTIGNIFNEGIENIVKGYDPLSNKVMSMLLDGGIMKLLQFAEENGRKINVGEYYSACDLCADCVRAINGKS